MSLKVDPLWTTSLEKVHTRVSQWKEQIVRLGFGVVVQLLRARMKTQRWPSTVLHTCLSAFRLARLTDKKVRQGPLKESPPLGLFEAMDCLFSNYLELHVYIGITYSLLLGAILPLWETMRFEAYDVLAQVSHYGNSSSPQAQFLSLIMPHAVNATKSFRAGLHHALQCGIFLCFLVSSACVIFRQILRLSWRSQAGWIVTRYMVSVLLGCELMFLFVALTHPFFGMSTNFKIPGWPTSVWPDVLGTTMATSLALAGKGNFDLSLRPLKKLRNLKLLECLTDTEGLNLLRSLIIYPPNGSNLNRGDSGLIALSYAAITLDVSMLVLKGSLLFRYWKYYVQLKPLKRVLLGPIIYFVAALAIAFIFLVHFPSCTMSDDIPPAIHLGEHPPVATRSRQALIFTRSLPGSRSDGRRLALDVYLPDLLVSRFLDDVVNFEKSQTFISATRYNRRMDLRWPFTGLSMWGQDSGQKSVAFWTWPMIKGLLDSNVPVVIVDTRGSGASDGHRTIDLDRVEVDDLFQTVQWIRRQFWTNSFVAGGGVSYDGMTSLKLAATYPLTALNMTAGLFSPLDPVNDLFLNNGLTCRSFIHDYSGFTRDFEKRGNPARHLWQSSTSFVPIQIRLGFLFAFRGPELPRGWEESFSLRERRENFDLGRAAQSVTFVDNVLSLRDGRQMRISEAGLNKEDLRVLLETDVPSYWAAGTCDSTGVRRTRTFFDQLVVENKASHRLIVGPWGHGGKRGCGVSGTWTCAEASLYRDLGSFIRDQGRSGGYIAFLGDTGFVKQSPPAVGERPTLIFALSGEEYDLSTAAWQVSLSPTHLLALPRDLLYDLYVHFLRRDLVGVAYDLAELFVVLGSRFNQVVVSARGVLRLYWNILSQEQHSKPTLDWVAELRALRSGHLRLVTRSKNKDPPETPLRALRVGLGRFGFSTTGSLSRWSIVQHLMRLPLDTGHALACTLQLRTFLDRLRVRAHGHASVSTLVFTSERLGEDLQIDGEASLQLPILITPQEGVGDLAVIAILLETEQPHNIHRTRYITEGRGLLSMRTTNTSLPNAIPLSNVTSELPQLLHTGIPGLRPDDLNTFQKETWAANQYFVTDIFQNTRHGGVLPTAVLGLLQVGFETAITRVRRGRHLQLILLPEDMTNFPWTGVEDRLSRALETTVKLLDEWDVILGSDSSTINSAWLKIPLGANSTD